MADATKRVNIERDPAPEEETKEGVVNDSLGTVDPADATGLDENRPVDEKSGMKSSEDS
ncbi:MAG: hypothetical protein ABSF28_20430 [Terracidiphilus sp.]|jgi:hypothetical protein